MKTLEMLLREGTEILETAEIGEARLDAWLLLEYITGKNRAYYYAHMDQETEEEMCIRDRSIPFISSPVLSVV